jgi:CRISPR-associated endonuclease/helicase Cas3
MAQFYAHTLENHPESEWETMAEHEERVRRYCRCLLGRIDPGLVPWADLLGSWHDLGKYLPAFQKKLRLADPRRARVEHSALGAVMACRLGQRVGIPAAFAIAGHHTGLANESANDPQEFPRVARIPLQQRLRDAKGDLDGLLPVISGPLVNLPAPALPRWLFDTASREAGKRSYAFFIRMLFSALVDADRLASAEFEAKAQGQLPERRRLRYDTLSALRERLDRYVDALSSKAAAERPSAVNAMRAEVLAACRRAAELPSGLFSLTVPTGGAKTLSGMSFALRHAIAHGLDRVIVVIPFTSIIDQNALRYREALGIDGKPDNTNVLEHHSGIDEQKAEEMDSEGEDRRRLAAENWDAPIVVTTSVQFFESLFSDHPSRCRKLHRIARSVIILDEVQTLPPGLLLPILDVLKELSGHYGSTVVLSTATPPALAEREGFPEGLKGVRAIIPNAVQLAASPAAQRVRVDWRVSRVTPYEELAREIAADHRQVLVVVHRRADAHLLAENLPAEGRFHLSALMCPAHRLERIEQIVRALKEGAVCRVVSTQLIEAGVDVDFPVVYRALAGLDSLAQSAGRCDREGLRSEAAGEPVGQFIVFRAETAPPQGTLRRAMQSTERLLGLNGTRVLPDALDPSHPEHCELFFRELYGKTDLDPRHVQRETAERNFANVAAAFRMIDDDWSASLVVPWGDGRMRIEAFQRETCARTRRALQPFMVQVSKRYLEHLLSIGAAEAWEETNLHLPTRLFGNRYGDEFGLSVEPDLRIDPELLTV